MATDNYDRVVGEVLADARKSLGLTQGEVADAAGITTSMLGFYERAESRCSTGMFMRISLKAFAEKPSVMMERVEQRLLDEAGEIYY